VLQGNDFLEQARNKIYSKVFQYDHRIGKNSFTRERKLTFPTVFSMILKFVTKSLSIECEWLEPDPSRIAPSKQAFSKARYKIAHTGFQELLDLSIDTLYKHPQTGTWRGYRVIAADGSSLRLPDSTEIEREFGRFKCNATEGKKPILGRVSLFVDLCTSLILSARLASWGVGEQTLAEAQLPEVVNKLRSLRQEQFLFVYDRGYPSYQFIKQHNELKADYIFRLQKGTYKKLWEKVESGETDFIFELDNVTQQARVVTIPLASGELEVLLTSLLDQEKFPLADISKIYFLRWHIEECYKRLKIGTELENFSGVHLEAVLQEFWAHLVMCNTLSLYMCDNQGFWDPDNTPEYRLNFSVLFGSMRELLQKVIVGKSSSKQFQKLFNRIASRAKVKVRPGRLYSRHMVNQPIRYHVFRRNC
jgi:hypothetical protein